MDGQLNVCQCHRTVMCSLTGQKIDRLTASSITIYKWAKTRIKVFFENLAPIPLIVLHFVVEKVLECNRIPDFT